MDILIKNIGGLPEDGDLTLTITPKGQVILGGCIFTSNFGKEVKAVALPEHGRLIDADAEIAKLEAFMKVLNKETESGGRQYHECDCVLHYLTDALTIVEATE